MIPRKPYLLRAMVEWAEDNQLTPLVAVDATLPGVRVPTAFVEDGRITLNISFSALHQRQLGNEMLSGYGRFGGRSEYLEVPMEAVTALVVRETGEGMVFPEEDLPDEEQSEQEAPSHLQSVDSDDRPAPDDDDPGPDGDPPPKGKPRLKIVK